MPEKKYHQEMKVDLHNAGKLLKTGRRFLWVSKQLK